MRTADAHNDLVVELAYRSREADPFKVHYLDQFRAGGMTLTVCPLSVEMDQLPEGALRIAALQCGALHRAARENPESVRLCGSGQDLRGADEDGRIALVISMEGTEPLGYNPELLEPFIALGVRMVGLTWNRRTPFGDGVGEIESDGGLSAMGRQLVDLLVERQIAIDLAHVSPRATDQVLERAGDGHLIASHVGCRALYDIPRNLTDDQLRAIGSKGGLVGVMPHPVAVGIDGGGPTLDKVVDHIDHMVDLVGADQVVIGSDFSRQLIRSGALHIPPDVIMPAGMELDAVVPGLAGPADMPALAKRMSERGYAPADLERILHGNLLAFLERVLDGHPSIADYGNGDG